MTGLLCLPGLPAFRNFLCGLPFPLDHAVHRIGRQLVRQVQLGIDQHVYGHAGEARIPQQVRERGLS